MKPHRFRRRAFLLGALVAAPLLAAADAAWIEPRWVKVRRLRLHWGKPACRVVHITDVHHKGDRAYLAGVVRMINALSPELACFTGDLIEEPRHLEEALAILRGIKSPLYGIPGNHDFWSKTSFEKFQECFSSTGGRWLMDEQTVTADGRLTILGAAWLSRHRPPLKPAANTANVFLLHYPAWIEKLPFQNLDLILAGHSHGGQVRIPFFGPLVVPFGVDRYDLGLFRTRVGPFYVNPGLGWFPVPIRFNCRPEITAFDVVG
jgi:hypothetical protein